jgi:hypothetical protein
VGAVDTARFLAHNLTFVSDLVKVWNAALAAAAAAAGEVEAAWGNSAAGRVQSHFDFRQGAAATVPPAPVAREAAPPAVRNVTVLGAAAGAGGGAGGASVSLAVVTSVARMAAVWASLNSTPAAAASSSSFQHLSVGVLLNGSYGFPANLTASQLWVGKTSGHCFVCVDPDVCDITARYDPECGSEQAPSHGYCIWNNEPGDAGGGENTCQCNQGFSGPHCGTGGVTPELPATPLMVVEFVAGILSIIFTGYGIRKLAIARLRSRHRPSSNGGRPSAVKFDCRDRITIALLCGTYHEDDDDAAGTMKEILDPLVSAQDEEEAQQEGEGGCCAALRRWCGCCQPGVPAQQCLRPPQQPRAEFASSQSSESGRNVYESAQSHAT